MDFIFRLLSSRDFLIAAFAAMSAAAVVFTFGASFVGKADMRSRIKRVALERERLRAVEMARLRGGGSGDGRTSARRGAETKDYMKAVVERFSLQKVFADDSTVEALARAGYRGQGHLTTYVFARFATPFLFFALALAYFSLSLFADKPLYLNAVYAVGVGLLGAYLPTLILKNRTIKRQHSIRRAWPDCRWAISKSRWRTTPPGCAHTR